MNVTLRTDAHGGKAGDTVTIDDDDGAAMCKAGDAVPAEPDKAPAASADKPKRARKPKG